MHKTRDSRLYDPRFHVHFAPRHAYHAIICDICDIRLQNQPTHHTYILRLDHDIARRRTFAFVLPPELLPYMNTPSPGLEQFLYGNLWTWSWLAEFVARRVRKGRWLREVGGEGGRVGGSRQVVYGSSWMRPETDAV